MSEVEAVRAEIGSTSISRVPASALARHSPLLGDARSRRFGGQHPARRDRSGTRRDAGGDLDAALHAGLHSEKYLLDGRISEVGEGTI
jgi:hypothetical protein